jgi:hypothetical protein
MAKKNPLGLNGISALPRKGNKHQGKPWTAYRVWIHNPENSNRMKTIGTWDNVEDAITAHDEASFKAWGFRYPLMRPQGFLYKANCPGGK